MITTTQTNPLIQHWKTRRIDVQRPSWHRFFLGLAYEIAKRSPDAQTQCGCVIVDSNKHIISTGYNGWIKNIDNSILPNLRPEKYPFMLHAELNAILNTTTTLKNSIVYVTGHPCVHCFQCLYQVGISTIIYGPNKIHMLNEEQDILLQILKDLTKHQIKVLTIEEVEKNDI